MMTIRRRRLNANKSTKAFMSDRAINWSIFILIILSLLFVFILVMKQRMLDGLPAVDIREIFNGKAFEQSDSAIYRTHELGGGKKDRFPFNDPWKKKNNPAPSNGYSDIKYRDSDRDYLNQIVDGK